MGILNNTFANLKTSIVGTSTSNIDKKLDLAVKDIISYKTNSNRNSYIELIKGLISKNADIDINPNSSSGLFNQGINPSTFGQSKRLGRYKMYESIVYNINYCFRALNVLSDNILSPDDITKISLDVSPKNHLEDETPSESKTKYVEEIISKLKIEDKLPIITKSTLQFGDFFCEIGDEKTALTSQSILTEREILTDYNKDFKQDFNVKIDNENYKITLDYSSFLEEKKDVKNKNKKEKDLDDLKLILHEASNVVRLQSGLFPICFGYLVFPNAAINTTKSLEDNAVNAICSTILKNIAKEVPQIKDISNDEDLKDIIGSMLKYSNPSKAINIRYVSPNKMVHFRVPSTKYYPYGESIFDPCQFSAKMLVALETSLTIHRLSRSTEKRKIGIEIGLPRDARKVIEQMKETFRKRKVSLDTIGTIDTIPSLISTYEDIYVPQKNGVPYVDIQSFSEGNVDTGSKVDEIKFIRDSVVASLGIPPSFIGLEENLSNKSALTEENILFARTIIGHQKYLTSQINELIKKVMEIINPEEALTLLDNVHIIISPPKSLQFERENIYMNNMISLIEGLERIGIPREYSKKKYLSQLDWTEIQKYKIDEDIDKSIGTEKEEDSGMGGMSGY